MDAHEQLQQLQDDQVIGDTYFNKRTYEEIINGLKLLVEKLNSFNELVVGLKVDLQPYQNEIKRINNLISSSENWLQKSRGHLVMVFNCSTAMLRYYKTGLMLMAQMYSDERNTAFSNYISIPRTIIKASNEKIQQIRNMAEEGILNRVSAYDLFIERTNEQEPIKFSSNTSIPILQIVDDEIPIIDQELRQRCLFILRNLQAEENYGQFDTVIREISVILEDRIRNLSQIGESLSGSKLLTEAIKKEPNKILFSENRDQQEAAYLLFMGYSGFIRNEVMHRLVPNYTYERVVQLMGFVDYLLYLLSQAKIIKVDKNE